MRRILRSEKNGVSLSNTNGANARKIKFRWTGPYWIIGVENDTFQLGIRILAGEVLHQKVNGFRLKSYLGPTSPNPFHAVKEMAEESQH